jgi:hypothetical protein
MKANELMVDDWVLWKGKPVQVASVSGVKYSFGQIDVTLAHCNDKKLLETHDIKSIQPIPLTPEILEKNGFVKQDDGWYKITLEENNLVGVQNFENVSWIFGAIVFPNLIDHLGINYVHELQHALKLCKIDKKIVL